MCGLSAYELINTAASATYEDVLNAIDSLDVENSCISIVEPV